MRKRTLCALLAAALVLSLSGPAFAAASPTVSVSSGTVKAGESVTLTVSIQDNPGIAGAIWYIYYDTDVFTADPDTDVAPAGAFASKGSVVGNTISRARSNGRYDGEAGKNGLLVLWDSNTATNVTSSGEMLTVTLHAKADAVSGSYTIGVGQSKANTANQKLEKIACAFQSGTVTVTDGAEGPAPSQKPQSGFQTADECLKNSVILQIDNFAALSKGELKAIDPDNHDVTPVLRSVGAQGDRTLVPVRFVAETLGAQVEWNGEKEQVIIRQGASTIVMTIGSKTYTVDGASKTMDVAPAVEPGWDRTLVPIRFVAEALGMEVEWDNAHQFVLITPRGLSWNLDGAVESEAVGKAMGLFALRSFL